MPQKLKAVELDEVSLVDRPANQHAVIVLSKRDDDACKGDVCKAPAGVQFNIGFKPEGGSEIQSVVFDSELWDEEKAKAWLKDHDMVSGKMDQTKNTLRFRQKDPEGYSRFRMITPGAQVSKALKAKDSWSNVQRVIDSALREKFEERGDSAMPAAPGGYVYVRDLFKDSAIFEQDGVIYRTDYVVEYDGEGNPAVAFSNKVPQQVVYQDVKKAEEKPPEVPAELLFKLGRLEAQATLLTHRVNKIRPIKVR